MKRKITVILAADVAGYAQFLASGGERALTELEAGKASFTRLVTQHDGRVFNAAGDQLLAEFPSAVEALRCALAVQNRQAAVPVTVATGVETTARGGVGSAPCRLQYRIGITIGDVVDRNGDLFGDGVNIAARLQGVAQPGGICVSRAVTEQIGNRVAARFTDLGPQKLKNMPEPVQAYAVSAGPPGSATQRIGRSSLFVPWAGGAAVVAAAVIFLAWRATPAHQQNNEPRGGSIDQSGRETAGTPARPTTIDTGNVDIGRTSGRSSAQCRDILERAQLGQLSRDDRLTLEQYCK
jgi:class 3 adenylate cyclase